jgi:hypothetical protein
VNDSHPKYNFYRRDAKSAEKSKFSFAVKRNGKRKDLAIRINPIDPKAAPFSFSLSGRKAEKGQPSRP